MYEEVPSQTQSRDLIDHVMNCELFTYKFI